MAIKIFSLITGETFTNITMDLNTTKSPEVIILDPDEPVPPSRTVNHEKLAAHTMFVIFAVTSSLCVLITVIRTKSV